MSRGPGDETGEPRGKSRRSRGESPEGARARLFVALTLEAEVCARLAAWARATLGGEPRVRLLDADALHLTLCFLGGVELDAVDAISAALADVVGAPVEDPLMFSVAEVRWLPPRRSRVCAVALRDSEGHAAALQSALAERLTGGGWYAPERRGWLPHVTVARVGRGGRVRRARDAGAAGARGDPEARAGSRGDPGARAGSPGDPGARAGSRGDPGVSAGNPAPPALDPFPATAVALMRSWPGSRYETLARIVL